MKYDINAQETASIQERKIVSLNAKSKKLIKLLSVCILFTLGAFNVAMAAETSELPTNATVIGKVFHDQNNNGIQDKNENGIPGVRLATVTGLVLETDGYGRYHLPDNVVDSRFNRHFIIKIDTASLPVGSIVKSENPRLIRLTSGSLNKVNFAVNY
ncbi:hypothetical protein GCM10009133_05260 [Cocleimonas flava]|uniref:hypothetical protein n=1 Tax=Cocleimonas flava TaxID=634765 RepID=UPI00104F7517|nr:hypothetical protein [Cocleimonas flava]